MGMAASQARFLGLTARKSNTEYEGQQINQQRTTLANQSANYYNQLLGMTVPVPPSVSDYTKTVYSFTDGALENTITSMIAQANGKYTVSYTSSWTNDYAMVSTSPAVYTRVEKTPGEYEYSVGANVLRQLGSVSDYDFSYNVTYTEGGVDKTVVARRDQQGYYTSDEQGTKTYYTPKAGTTPTKAAYVGNDQYLKTLSVEQIENLMKEESLYADKLKEKYGASVDGWMVRYVLNSTTGAWSPYFANKDDLESATYSETGYSQSSISTYTVGSAKETEEIKGVSARVEMDTTGRIINITLNPDDPTKNVTYSVNTSTVTDQAKYDDAMNQYSFDKAEYDKSIQDINSKIEVVQAQDRNLELRLKQLDTEQKAIQTEIDAVEKVIEKNTESTFKTFG